MNNARRKKLAAIQEKLEVLLTEVEEIYEEEQDAFNAMPESLQQGERGQASEQAIEHLSETGPSIQSAIDSLSSAQE